MASQRAINGLRVAGVVVCAAALLCGCATPALDSARHNFYAGKVAEADKTLDETNIPDKDRVLFLMERGTVRQAAARYDDSSKDYIEASDLIDKLWTYSVSKGAASWVVNDGVEDFRGTPFERTLLHSFTAIDHLAQANWDNAGVEARRIIRSLTPEAKGDYPDDAFSHYMAGFCLEMINDDSNAGMQYRGATKLLKNAAVDPTSGHIIPRAPTTNAADKVEEPPSEKPWPNELVCFVFIGRSPRGNDIQNDMWYSSEPMYAGLYQNGRFLGRSYNFADTVDLAFTTDQLEAARKMAKTVGRVFLKEAIASSVEQSSDNEALGDLVRFVLIGLLERPDVRRWETLPRWLQVARVPCAAGPEPIEVRLFSPSGVQMRTSTVTAPIQRNGNVYVTFWRDIAP